MARLRRARQPGRALTAVRRVYVDGMANPKDDVLAALGKVPSP